jgi:hypothetical protein
LGADARHRQRVGCERCLVDEMVAELLGRAVDVGAGCRRGTGAPDRRQRIDQGRGGEVHNADALSRRPVVAVRRRPGPSGPANRSMSARYARRAFGLSPGRRADDQPAFEGLRQGWGAAVRHGPAGYATSIDNIRYQS